MRIRKTLFLRLAIPKSHLVNSWKKARCDRVRAQGRKTMAVPFQERPEFSAFLDAPDAVSGVLVLTSLIASLNSP